MNYNAKAIVWIRVRRELVHLQLSTLYGTQSLGQTWYMHVVEG